MQDKGLVGYGEVLSGCIQSSSLTGEVPRTPLLRIDSYQKEEVLKMSPMLIDPLCCSKVDVTVRVPDSSEAIG